MSTNQGNSGQSSQDPRDPEAILRNSLPIDAPQLQDLQHRLESTSDDLRAKRWKPLAGSVTRSQALLTTQRDAILKRFDSGDQATAAELLDRLEAGALFSEESCSFSQKDLLDSLQLWADKARAKLSNP